jgi:hypothetical protein
MIPRMITLAPPRLVEGLYPRTALEKRGLPGAVAGVARVGSAMRWTVALSLLFLCLIGAARADVVNGGRYRVSFTGEVRPNLLPRHDLQPITVSVRGAVTPLPGNRPAPLSRFEVAFNRHAHLFTKGLPICPRGRLAASTTREALKHCPEALVGTGHFFAHIDLPEQAPFPSRGRTLLFNSSFHGHPALLAQVYGRQPVPTTQVLPFAITHSRRRGFDVTLAATMPQVGEDWGYVTGFDFTLSRSYLYRGRLRSVVSANCPAPKGFTRVPFKLAEGSFFLADGSVRRRALGAICRVRPD